MAKNAPILWENIEKVESEDFEKVADLDAICFSGVDYERLIPANKIYGEVYALKVYGFTIGYAIYGQVWLPEHSDGYITRIGVHPQHRQLGWGRIMLENILSDLNTRTTPKCPVVHGDIRKSNIASQNLFRKMGFEVHYELDDVYDDEKALRVMKPV